MKSQFVSFFLMCSLSLFANPWAHRYSAEQANENFALAVATDFNVSVEWGEGDWDANGSRFGYGLSQDGSDWNWDNEVFWFQDGDGANKRCRATIQLPHPGKFYYAFKMIKGGTHYYASGSDSWAETSTTLSAVSYISVGKYSVQNGNWSEASSWNTDAVATDKVGIYHTITLDESPTVVSLELNADSKLTIPSGYTLVNSGAVTQNASAVVEVKQLAAASRLWYWSSPISNAKVSVLHSDNNAASYTENGSGTWTIVTDAANTSMESAKGYVSNGFATEQTINFSGLVNSGDISVNLTKAESGTYAGFNLLGNPYPSYLNVENLIKDNSNISNTIWYRAYNGSQMVFDVVNLNDANANVINSGREKISGIIPPMQAFWVRATTATSLTFRNAMREHSSDNSTAFKVKGESETLAVSSPVNSELNSNKYLKLQISNGQYTDQTLIYFNPEAKNEPDDFDSPKFFNNVDSVAELFSVVDNQKLVINGYESLSEFQSVQLGVKTLVPGVCTIKISSTENFSDNIDMILYDALLGERVMLNETNGYSFQTTETESTDRFSLILKVNSDITGTNNNLQNNLNLSVHSSKLRMSMSQNYEFNKIEIFDLAAKLIYSINSLQMEDIMLGKGLYIAKIYCQNNVFTQVLISK